MTSTPDKRPTTVLYLPGHDQHVDSDQSDALLTPPLNTADYPVQANGLNERPVSSKVKYNTRKSNYPPVYRKAKRRALYKNGDFNIIRVNISKLRRRYLQDLFTTLVDAQWRWTLLVFCMSFLLSWFAFGVVWYLIAYTHGDLLPENQTNAQWSPCVINMHTFVASFLFSVETQHTTGFGYRMVTEECPEAIAMFCFQSIAGLMIQAFMVGIVFAKMARPKQRSQTLMFSRNAVICQRDGQLCFMFRVGDMREKSQLIGATIRARYIRSRVTAEGETLSPHVSYLKVSVDDYDEQVFLMWPMVAVHRIDRESPFYGMSAADLLHERFEVAVVLEGTTESTGQTTQARTSYVAAEVLWGHRFRQLVSYCKTKMIYEVDYSQFHDTCKVDTPLCSAKDLQAYLMASEPNRLVGIQ
ncbi:G protein-activated inward rectifier potassium channel 3-like [Adelges cooleyi]|uniref:G protein-activated inward rectifier potassium channel 3-like n=1 Tax=Adelges cooleyi TaxID=133065 RepID=UPI00217F3C31|nr:G protein-activated inward rectifier potassium channel 3-like [Adelges cooleyi]XP_050419776.1 G protein-activated inward rectifier potassium channel 3-like [Adelges cooleyi]XP_050419777.1 G protein-activated inward rectifier potassium channel 3-like [Adelges cooleyi]XP_050419778.1 G protein-activated inward rectifier potassium channel 3-like [Adelges cooleyi]XP_050419779.1 G protein-activated inward rectifier potassium channel 3-like [Adelges cooleyi]